MVLRETYKCPFCGNECETSFDVPEYDDDYDKKLMAVNQMNSIFCNKCELYFKRGIQVMMPDWSQS